MKRAIVFLNIFLTPFLTAFSQGSAGSGAFYESRHIVDMPNAGVMPKGTFSIYSVAFGGGGVMAEITAAPFDAFNMGISFAATNFIGSGTPEYQKIPGVHLKYRFLDETKGFPALAAGVNIQGNEKYMEKEERFKTMSPGLYLALSKEFGWQLGKISLHGGVCYSFEPPPENRAPNFFLGLEQSIGRSVSLVFEYNANNDEKNKTVMEEKGLLNIACNVTLSKGFTVGFQARDVLEHYAGSKGFTRCIMLEYINNF